MSTTNIIPLVNAFIKTIRAVPIRFKVENLPVVSKSFITIPVGTGAVKLEVVKGTTLCVHIYSSLEIVRRDSAVDFLLKNRVYTSPTLSKSEDIQQLLTTLSTLLPEAVRSGHNTECLTKELESAILPLLKKGPKSH